MWRLFPAPDHPAKPLPPPPPPCRYTRSLKTWADWLYQGAQTGSANRAFWDSAVLYRVEVSQGTANPGVISWINNFVVKDADRSSYSWAFDCPATGCTGYVPVAPSA